MVLTGYNFKQSMVCLSPYPCPTWVIYLTHINCCCNEKIGWSFKILIKQDSGIFWKKCKTFFINEDIWMLTFFLCGNPRRAIDYKQGLVYAISNLSVIGLEYSTRRWFGQLLHLIEWTNASVSSMLALLNYLFNLAVAKCWKM